MASQQKAPKQGSRWNFIQQAVASVESRLDTILADEEDAQRKGGMPSQPAKENVQPKRISADISRSNSGAQVNDRLQEKLARAMVKKPASRAESPMPPSEPPSRTTTPILSQKEEDAPTASNRFPSEAPSSNDPENYSEKNTVSLVVSPLDAKAGSVTDSGVKENAGIVGSSAVVSFGEDLVPSVPLDPVRVSTDSFSGAVVTGNTTVAGIGQGPSSSAHSNDLPYVADDSVQAEINGYIERIDALQAKLLYLTKEVATSARQAAASANSGSAESRILEKDEKIALLMEEGQKLSKTEMKHSTTIKKLRTQVATATKEHTEVKHRAERAEKRISNLEERARRAEAASKRTEESLAASLNSSRDFDIITKERNALTATVADMKVQIARANTRAEQAESKVQSDQLEKQTRRIQELQDDLTSAKVERELSEEKLRREIRDFQASLEREKERSQAMETEMLGEQAMLESKLEAFRTRAEEATSNDHGDTQAKLLRQIETLQSQYASASQNWQGIEGTLLARITNLEKERDDTTMREGDVRKKLRDATLKGRQIDRELEEARGKLQDLERSQTDAQDEAQRTLRRAQQLEEELNQTKKDMEDQRVQAEKEIHRRLEEERTKWLSVNTGQRQDSPGLPIRKTSGFDAAHLMNPVQFDRAQSRRSSTMQSTESHTPPRQHSATSFRAHTNGMILETPSIITPMDDEYFVNVPETPASQTHTTSNRGVHDIISTSTIAAGPSLQLVERMSANVRRLESEKEATKEELARLTSQRDDARHEIVDLMREVEPKRALDERLQKIEAEHASLNQRYQTTLEMLGEKSELVEELKADVTDVKQMYRELVDTLK